MNPNDRRQFDQDRRELALLRQEMAAAEEALAEAQPEVDRCRWAIAEIEEGGPSPAEVADWMFGRAAEAVEMNEWFHLPAPHGDDEQA